MTNTTILAKKPVEEKKEETYETAKPKEILGQFNSKWITETLALKKWDAKCNQLKDIQEAASFPRLADGNYGELFEALKKMAGDNHAAISQNAIKAIGCLAQGLRHLFHDMALQAVPVFFMKFKEKRIVEDIMDNMSKILLCV